MPTPTAVLERRARKLERQIKDPQWMRRTAHERDVIVDRLFDLAREVGRRKRSTAT